jgi:hypothetical protein
MLSSQFHQKHDAQRTLDTHRMEGKGKVDTQGKGRHAKAGGEEQSALDYTQTTTHSSVEW